MEKLFNNLVKSTGDLIGNVGDEIGKVSNGIISEGSKLVDNTAKTVQNLSGNVELISQETMMSALDWAYEQTINGVPGQKTVHELVDEYLEKYDKETAIEKLIQSQAMKSATSGFVTGFGGLLMMPITLPINVTSVLLVQMRMIAAIATIRGYDLKDDQVQTYVYVALTGSTVADIAKTASIKIGEKLLEGMIKKIPGKLLMKINQAVGFKLVTKFGEKGIINFGRLVPVAGALIGGTVDTVTTLAIAEGAKNTFTELGYNLGDGTLIDKKVIISKEENLEN